MYVVAGIDTDYDNEVSIWETGFKTFEDAKETVLKVLKDNYDCPVLESYDSEELEDGEYIVEDELAHYYYGDRDFYYTINHVSEPV